VADERSIEEPSAAAIEEEAVEEEAIDEESIAEPAAVPEPGS